MFDLDLELSGSYIDSDLLRYYNLDINGFDLDDPVFFERVCGLIGNLPAESETMTILRGGELFEFTDLIISRIEYLIHSYLLANSKEKNKKTELMIPEYIKERLNGKDKNNDSNVNNSKVSPMEHLKNHRERVEKILKKKREKEELVNQEHNTMDDTLKELSDHSNFS